MPRSDDCRCYCGRSVRDPIPVIGHVDNPIDGEIPAQCIMHEFARLLPERLWLFTNQWELSHAYSAHTPQGIGASFLSFWPV